MAVLEEIYFGNSVRAWMLALGVGILTALFLVVARKIVIKRLNVIAQKTLTTLDDLAVELLRRTRFLFLLILSFFAGTFLLTLTDAASKIIESVVVLAFLLQGAVWGNGVISHWIGLTTQRRMAQDAASATMLSAVGFVSKLLLWSIMLLLSLDNLGVDITALVAGLGVGGIAVALALQNILSDLFASLSIVLDKPFAIGDFIIVDQFMGTVEHVGLKTTRIRSLSGEQIIFSNTDLLKSRVRNFKRMYERRVEFAIGVVYQTPYEKLKGLGGMIREIIEHQSRTRFDRAHFKTYADSALVYEVVYYVLNPDYNLFMDIQESINLELFRRFQEEGIQFAYPTKTIYIAQELTPTNEEDKGKDKK